MNGTRNRSLALKEPPAEHAETRRSRCARLQPNLPPIQWQERSPSGRQREQPFHFYSKCATANQPYLQVSSSLVNQAAALPLSLADLLKETANKLSGCSQSDWPSGLNGRRTRRFDTTSCENSEQQRSWPIRPCFGHCSSQT